MGKQKKKIYIYLRKRNLHLPTLPARCSSWAHLGSELDERRGNKINITVHKRRVVNFKKRKRKRLNFTLAAVARSALLCSILCVQPRARR